MTLNLIYHSMTLVTALGWGIFIENKDELRRNVFKPMTDKSDLSREPSTVLPLSPLSPAGLGLCAPGRLVNAVLCPVVLRFSAALCGLQIGCPQLLS